MVEQMEREEQEKFQQQKEAEMAALAESRNPKRKAEEKHAHWQSPPTSSYFALWTQLPL
jgi:hypothetical protein